MLSKQEEETLKKTYDSLNPAELKRKIDEKLLLLYKAHKKKKDCLHWSMGAKNRKKF